MKTTRQQKQQSPTIQTIITDNKNNKPSDVQIFHLKLILATIDGESTVSTRKLIEIAVSTRKLIEIEQSTERSNIAIDNKTILNETNDKVNDKIISIPSIIILVSFIIFLSYILRQKQDYQIKSDKLYASRRLMQLRLNQQNNLKDVESAKFIKSNRDTETSVSEVKPLRNISEESDLSRSLMASLSSEQEDENSLERKKSLIEKRQHY